MKRSFSILAVLSAAAITVQAGAQTSNIITSCVSKLTSVSRIVASAASCNTNTETVTYWNQSGPQGMQGAIGPQGVPGPTGPKGPAGGSLVPVITWYTNAATLAFAANQDFYLSCPSGTLVGTGCGVRAYDTGSIDSTKVAYVGPDTNPGNASTGTAVTTMACKVSNAGNLDFQSNVITYSAACLTFDYNGPITGESVSARQAPTYSTCSYDPDTQQPCTRADAVVTAPLAGLTAKPTADEIAMARTQRQATQETHAEAVGTNHTGTKVTHKKVTLWFEN